MKNQNGKTILKFAIATFAVFVVIGYSYFQARNLINGPQITIQSPANGATLDSPLVDIKGMAKNISFISLNDRQIFVDKDGAFSEKLLLSPGYNLWKITAKDKFGRVISKNIELVFNKT